jgi:hypothetical protein
VGAEGTAYESIGARWSLWSSSSSSTTTNIARTARSPNVAHVPGTQIRYRSSIHSWTTCAEPNDIATFVDPCQRRNLTTNQNPI